MHRPEFFQSGVKDALGSTLNRTPLASGRKCGSRCEAFLAALSSSVNGEGSLPECRII